MCVGGGLEVDRSTKVQIPTMKNLCMIEGDTLPYFLAPVSFAVR